PGVPAPAPRPLWIPGRQAQSDSRKTLSARLPARSGFRANRRALQDCGAESSRWSSRELSELTPEDQTQHEPNAERREYRLGRIFTHVLLRVFLERADAASCVPPRLFRFTACLAPSLLCLSSVLVCERACG